MPARLWKHLCACLVSAATLAAAETPAATPDLVVVISIDQMRHDYLARFAPWLAEGGFSKLLKEGAVFPDAAHRHGTTMTAAGHATIGSGLDPRDHSVIANDWFDRIADEPDECVHDPHVTTSASSQEGSSPINLTYRGLGDALKERYNGSRVIGISMKDRSAILMAGRKADAAYWYDDEVGKFVSSSYYRWNDAVLAFNDRLPAVFEAHPTWELSGIIPADELERVTFDPEELHQYKRDRNGLGAAFPHPIGNARAVQTSPLMNTLVVDFAMHVIRVETLGTRDGTPDLLFVGPSSIDYIGHDFGPDSKELADAFVQLDRDIERFLKFLDERLEGRYTVVLTSDHGVQQIPEVAKAQGKHAGRFRFPNPGRLAVKMSDLYPARLALEKAVSRELGIDVSDDDAIESSFIRWADYQGFYLNWRTVDRHGIEPEAARRAVRKHVLEMEGVQAAWTASELLAATPPKSEIELAVRRSYRPDRSPDVFVVLEPGFIATWNASGTTHSQPVPDDQRVPLILTGVGVKRGTYAGEAAPADLARTLGSLLGVEAGADDTRALPCLTATD